ncbi:unnamed protein product [Brugia timori]|uniref:Uncharacterized protein n=1 Tax=Brugia timori TaxID=42155 RepID=A0A0R3RCA6_9BILA|nr:unnamed protein product [Brugia timori]
MLLSRLRIFEIIPERRRPTVGLSQNNLRNYKTSFTRYWTIR